MARTMVVSWALAVAVATAGCRICSSPYDYCGPTFTGECGEDCCSTGRAGSIFSGYGFGYGPTAPVPADGYLLEEDGYILSDELSMDEEADAGLVAEVDSETIEGADSDIIAETDFDTIAEADFETIAETDSGTIEKADSTEVVAAAAEEDVDSPVEAAVDSGTTDRTEPGVILSSAEEEIEEIPEAELPVLRPPQVAKKPQSDKKATTLSSDGWKPVKRRRSHWR